MAPTDNDDVSRCKALARGFDGRFLPHGPSVQKPDLNTMNPVVWGYIRLPTCAVNVGGAVKTCCTVFTVRYLILSAQWRTVSEIGTHVYSSIVYVPLVVSTLGANTLHPTSPQTLDPN